MDAQTSLYGVFGSPIRHSLSPNLHNAVFEKFGLNAAYLAFQVEPQTLGLAFEAIRVLGIRGVNITVPLKEDAVNFVDEIPEDLDRAIGAINTVVHRDGRFFGYNTDWRGFLLAVKEELRFNPSGKKILVLGAGGAARAVVFALAQADADKLWILNRSFERAQGLAEYLKSFFPNLEIEPLKEGAGLDATPDLVVNATSLGMKSGDPLPYRPDDLNPKTLVYDLVYSPSRTAFLDEVAKHGCASANGLGMLAAQAALSFGLWTGKSDGVREIMLEVLKKWRS